MPQVKEGIVISTKMTKTAVVNVVSRKKHPLYKKLTIRSKNFKAHDDIGVAVGQKVKIQETAPISKNVHFKILEVTK